MNKRRLGGYYEDAAGDYLVKNGLTILDKNVRCGRLGEIDLIGIDTTAVSDDTLVFAEIKYRSSDRFGQGVYAVDATKQKRDSSSWYHVWRSYHEYRYIRPCRPESPLL